MRRLHPSKVAIFNPACWLVRMCTLYSMTTNREAILRLFQVSDNRAAAVTPSSAIFPSNAAPVIRLASDGERELVNFSWGFVLQQQGKAPRRVVNFRDDKALTSPFWRESFVKRRCLVPASSFSEPKGERPATWHWFALKGVEPRPPFAFAGIWRHYKGPLKKDGGSGELDVYSILTTTPNELVSTINHERMPVLLTRETEFATWLLGTPEEAFNLTRQYPSDAMAIVQSRIEKADLRLPAN